MSLSFTHRYILTNLNRSAPSYVLSALAQSTHHTPVSTSYTICARRWLSSTNSCTAAANPSIGQSSTKAISKAKSTGTSGFMRVVAISVVGGATLGGWSAIRNKQKTRALLDAPLVHTLGPVESEKIPHHTPSRVMPGPAGPQITDIQKLTLYQYQTCPFCCKVRAFLDYFGLPYEIVEVNPVMRQQLKWAKPYRKVPILLAEVKTKEGPQVLQLNDSTIIISILASYLLTNYRTLEWSPTQTERERDLKSLLSMYQKTKFVDDSGQERAEVLNKYFVMYGDFGSEKEYRRLEDQLSEERNWRKWTDDELVHVLSPNIYRTWSEAVDSFKWFSQVGEWEKNFAAWERFIVIYVGAAAMLMIGNRLKKRHRLKDDVRLSLYDETKFWMKAIGKNRLFMGGDKPNLADLSVYGIMSSIEGTQAFKDLTKANPSFITWYGNMKELVSNHAGQNEIKRPPK